MPAGDYEVKISPSASRSFQLKPPVFQTDVTLEDGSSYAVFAVGSAAGGTLSAIPLVIAN